MIILQHERTVGTINQNMVLSTSSEQLRRLYAVLQDEGMETMTLGPNGEDIVTSFPVEARYSGLLANTLQQFGYEVR